jgi:serine/threonine-protein kinase
VGELVANATVAGRFRLLRKLGEGGMGVVWSAVDERAPESPTPVALKFMRVEGLADADSLRRFQREAKASMRLSHPNVVRVREVVITDDGQPAMVMDLLEGESLASKLARERTLTVPDFACAFTQILSAVGSAHAAGIVHRDLKPDNVFLVNGTDVRVLDFGIAKVRAPEGDAATTALTGTGAMLGTPFYMAPEQVFGERDVDHRVDVWALGVIMYECLAGKRPFAGENFGQVFKAVTRGDLLPLREAAPRLPRDLAAINARMLTVDRSQRLSDLREVFEVVRAYTDVDAQIFSAPTLPAGSNRDDFADALAPTLAADTGAAVARTGNKGSAFPPPTSRPRALWPFAAGAFAVLAIGGGVVLATIRSAPVSAVPVVGAPPPVVATIPSSVAPPLSAPQPVVATAPSAPSVTLSASIAPAVMGAAKPKPKPSASISASPPPPAPPPSSTSLAGGVAPKPPF